MQGADLQNIGRQQPARPGAVLLLKKLYGKHMITVASKHNKRQAYWTKNVDAAPLSVTKLYGPDTAEEVGDLARERLVLAGSPPVRKTAVTGIEVVVSLTPGSDICELSFFEASLEWVTARFGGVNNLLSAEIHHDESVPHMHVILLPLVKGRMNGSDLIGGPSKFASHPPDFGREVCLPRGVEPPPLRLSGTEKALLSGLVSNRLRETKDPVMESQIWLPLSNFIQRDPAPFANALGVSTEPAPTAGKRMRTLAQIMTSKGKGRQHFDQ